MIGYDEARRIAEEYVRANVSLADDEAVIDDEQTLEEDSFWVFFYNSRQYVETGDFRHMMAGNAPLVVTKEDGTVHPTGTALPLETYLERFRQPGLPERG